MKRTAILSSFVFLLTLAFCVNLSAMASAQESKKAVQPSSGKDELPSNVGDGERLSFDQSKVAAQMTELEERMFRLSEALKELEPENSSRLMLALNAAREELIQLQMMQTRLLLEKEKLREATTEQKQILAKLQRLEDLLLSTDLDFQMKLARLRKIREIIRQLEKALEEEQREKELSDQMAKGQERVKRLHKRLANLDQLIQWQTRDTDEGKKLAEARPLDSGGKQAVDKLAGRQQKTRIATNKISKGNVNGGAGSENLKQAATQMQEAVDALKNHSPDAAVPPQQNALAALKREQSDEKKRLEKQLRQLQQDRFASMRKDQEGNRKLTDRIAELVRQLGAAGAGPSGELIRASGSMSSAERQLGNQQAESASDDQHRALRSLKYARDLLQDEASRLLDELRGAVKRHVIAALTTMLEKQVVVREATEQLGPLVADGSRQARTRVVGLGKSEGKIIDVADEVLTMVEETEFGIALPHALRVVRKSMNDVRGSLNGGDASDRVVGAERQIEEDLKVLLDAMKRMPASRLSSPNRKRNKARDRERELNRLVAELKMIRFMQVRVHDDTVQLDDKRPDSISATIRKEIENLEDQQGDVLISTEKLSEQRGL